MRSAQCDFDFRGPRTSKKFSHCCEVRWTFNNMSKQSVYGTRPFTPEEKDITGQLLVQKVGGEHLATRSGGAAGKCFILANIYIYIFLLFHLPFY